MDVNPDEQKALLDAEVLERLNKNEDFQFFKAELLERIASSVDVFLGANSEAELWRSQGEARMVRNIYEMVEGASAARSHIHKQMLRREEEQAAAEMAALDLDAQKRLDHYRRTRRQP